MLVAYLIRDLINACLHSSIEERERRKEICNKVEQITYVYALTHTRFSTNFITDQLTSKRKKAKTKKFKYYS